jgi:hypothetical protein
VRLGEVGDVEADVLLLPGDVGGGSTSDSLRAVAMATTVDQSLRLGCNTPPLAVWAHGHSRAERADVWESAWTWAGPLLQHATHTHTSTPLGQRRGQQIPASLKVASILRRMRHLLIEARSQALVSTSHTNPLPVWACTTEATGVL